MAYNDEALKAKLSTLNETQDSIVSVSQWIAFHKRHADRIASYWLTRLRDTPQPKRLNYIYLVNDIVQNARARKRSEFPDAFSPLMPEALVTAYRSATPDVQNKIRRVVEVWRNRSVFETPIQSAIEARLDEVDKTKPNSGKKTLGGSLFGSSSASGAATSIPTELSTLPSLQIAVTKASLAVSPAVSTANSEYAKLDDQTARQLPPPVHAARLSSLMKSLATAESSVSASIKARQSLIADLERILDVNKRTLVQDEANLQDLTTKRSETEDKKRDVEDTIMRGLADDSEGQVDQGQRGGHRPEVEELTPEPDDFGLPLADEYAPTSTAGPSSYSTNPQLQGLLAGFGSTGSPAPPSTSDSNSPAPPYMTSRVRQASGELSMNGHATKRRKTSHGDEHHLVPDLGEMGMDESDFAIPGPDVSTPAANLAGALASPPPPPSSMGYPNFTASDGGIPGMMGMHQEESRDVLGTLDADVDELIRSEGA